MKRHHLFTTLIFVFFAFKCSSQQSKIDSLLVIIKTEKADTNKLIHLYNISDECETIGNYEDGLKYGKQALELADLIINETKDNRVRFTSKKYKARTFNNIGIIYHDQSNYSEALKNQIASLEIKETIGDKKGISASYNNIGLIYKSQGDYPEALKKYFASLKIDEALGDQKGIAGSYNNIGSIYNFQRNYQEALKNYFASLKIRIAIDDKNGIAVSYNNIGSVYNEQNNYSEALKNYNAALKIRETLDDKKGIADSYNNIGLIYSNQNNYPEALEKYFASLEIREAIGDKYGVAMSYINIGEVYANQKKYEEAGKCLIKAKELALEIGEKLLIKTSYDILTDLDSARGNYRGAYENHKQYILYRDSIDNEETRKKTIQSQMTYDFEKKELATKAEQDKKDAVALADKKRQQIFFWFLAALAIAIGIIAVVIFRGLQQSKKAKRVIEIQRDEISQQKEMVEHQKLIVEEHQKEMVDSITYAKRIQYTLLANKQLLDDNLNGNVISSSDKGGVSRNEHSEAVLDTSAKGADTRTDSNYFVLFKPKDIVSGDFYWATEKSWQSTVNKEEKIKRFYIAACDSTGHGVPGAFMSLLNISFLNEAVNEKNILEPHEILNHVRKRLIENMDGGQDGMDCILIKIETQTSNIQHPKSTITYAAANNSPAIIKNGNLISLGADKMPVGKGERAAPFTLRTIEVDKGDTLYLYTDGYADQFGGPKGKKFKYKQLDELLVSISNLPAGEQSEILNQRFDDWKAWPDPEGGVRNLEQVDDMLVIGIKI